MIAATLPILGHSEDCCQPPACLVPSEPLESCQLPAGYFYPGLLTLCNPCLNISLGGEFIYWQTNFAAVAQVGTRIRTDADGNTFTKELFHNQHWKPGFKVALGLGFPSLDHWELDMEYTWLHSTKTNHFNADFLNGEVIVSKILPQVFPIASSSLTSKQRWDLNFLYAVLGRPLYGSKRVIVNPSVGLQGWWAERKLDLTFAVLGGLPQGTQVTKNNVWGIGPFARIDVKMLLICGAYLTGKVGIWPLYSRTSKYSTDTNFPITVPPALFPGAQNVETNHKNPHEVHIFFQGGLRLGWGTYLCCNSYHIDLAVGYDLMKTIKRITPIEMGLVIDDFYAQGLTVRAQFDF